ncbi:hypothetical protein J6TS7_20670 [Paenibacillus dendritiformis]|uniref:helix-turn-helix domain-containing protein n=1 Tax=Paenibacillus TaxID=44249 RepID=UPI001B07A051|nr:hypothetical protein J6TS7_20670 [Paenibacillus dendritiformis]
MLTFEPFRIWLVKSKKSNTEVLNDCGFSPTTVAKIMKDRFPVRSDVIEKLCRVYHLRIDEVIEYREGKE